MLFNLLGLYLLLLFDQIQTKSIYLNRQIHYENFQIQMLGDECQSNDQCRRTPVDGTKICFNNQCQCSTGYVPIDSYRCIQDFVQVQVQTNPSIEESPGYGSLCTKNEDCQQLTVQLECFRGTCVCLEGYVPLGKYLCYNIHGEGAPIIESTTVTSKYSTSIQLMNKNCLTDNHCQKIISHSYCSNGKCQCLKDYILFDDQTCIENNQILISKEQSSDELMMTTLSIHYRSLLGGQCLTNENCQTTDARCVNQICICPLGSFPIDEWNCLEDSDSTKISTNPTFQWWPHSSTTSSSITTTISSNLIHLSCLFNEQCIRLDVNSHCRSRRCICNIGYQMKLISSIPRCIQIEINDETCD